MSFNVYIDESGEAGIAKVRGKTSRGASPYFVMAAAVGQPTAEVHAKNALHEIRNRIGKKTWKHATDLKHEQKVLLARELGRLPIRFFAVVSRKSTLDSYGDDIGHNPHMFYNKCAKYLIESICDYLAPHLSSPDELSIYFEEMNHDYDAMRRYLLKVRDNPFYRQSKQLSVMNPFCISTLKKGKNEMMEVADFVAHSVFQCVNQSDSNFGIPEPRYFLELSSRFAGDKSGKPIGVGLKFIKGIEKMGLEPEVERMFKNTHVALPAIQRQA